MAARGLEVFRQIEKALNKPRLLVETVIGQDRRVGRRRTAASAAAPARKLRRSNMSRITLASCRFEAI
jgi:hypothetical protein